MTISREDILKFRAGGWTLDFPELEVMGKNGVTFRGHGRLHQKMPDRLILTVFLMMIGSQPHKLPELPGRTRIAVTDLAGRKWIMEHATVLQLDCTGSSQFCTVVLDVPELWTEEEEPDFITANPEFAKHVSLVFYIFRELDFPANDKVTIEESIAGKKVESRSSNRVSKFDAGGHEFTCISEERYTVCAISSSAEKAPATLNLRIIEALQFIFALPCDWSILEEMRGCRTRLRVRPLKYWREHWRALWPPVDIRLENGEHIFRLFDSYLTYVQKCDESNWHMLSQHVHSLIEASDGAPAATLVTLGVEVEGLLNVFYQKTMASADFLEAVDKAEKYIRDGRSIGALGVSGRHARDICRHLGRLHRGGNAPRSTGNRLQKLAEDGVIQHEHVHAWNDIRNRSAHPDRRDRSPLSEIKNAVDKVLVLFYHLVFHQIGYRGMYTDWGTPGFPLREYPMQKAGTCEPASW